MSVSMESGAVFGRRAMTFGPVCRKGEDTRSCGFAVKRTSSSTHIGSEAEVGRVKHVPSSHRGSRRSDIRGELNGIQLSRSGRVDLKSCHCTGSTVVTRGPEPLW